MERRPDRSPPGSHRDLKRRNAHSIVEAADTLRLLPSASSSRGGPGPDEAIDHDEAASGPSETHILDFSDGSRCPSFFRIRSTVRPRISGSNATGIGGFQELLRLLVVQLLGIFLEAVG